MPDKVSRRNFLKGSALITGAAAVGLSLDSSDVPEIANFNEGTLNRKLWGDWRFFFSSPNKYNPSGEKEIVAEIGNHKFLLKGLNELEITETKKSGLFYYELTGTEWETIE